MPKTSLIILTRNEITGLTKVFDKIPIGKVDECFCVDFNSTDGTKDFLKKRNIKIIEQKKPGRSEAFRIGASHAKGAILIFFSPDGNENPSDIPILIKKIHDGAELAIASRFVTGARNEEDDQIIKARKWANQLFTTAVNIIWNGKVTDSINGYRAIKKSVFNKLNLDAEGFAIEYQMTIRALKNKLKIIEIPTIEGNRIGGKSSAIAIPTGLKFVYYLIREIILGQSF